MKTTTILLITLFILTFSVKSQTINDDLNITNGWKFHTGDNSAFSKPEFNDNGWENIRVGAYWEAQGHEKYDGIAYYRLRINIPASLKGSHNLINCLLLSLGKIDDEDITYFNGKEIGRNNIYNFDRNYFIPFELIDWGKENVIAVRVNDTHANGGMYQGNYKIGKVERLKDLISFSSINTLIKINLTSDSLLTRTIKFKLNYPIKNLPVRFQVKITDTKTSGLIYNKSSDLEIGTTTDSVFNFTFKTKSSGWLRVNYTLTSKFLKDSITSSSLLTYKKEIRINERIVEPVVNYLIPKKEQPFDLKNIQLSGYLGGRIDANVTERLLKIDEKGILECFYNRPGNQTWVGEYAGKYLHAAARAWRNSGNPELKTQMDRIADILINCQLSDGYLGTYLPANYWTEWDVWAHAYDLQGLISYYSVTGYQPAIDTSIKIGNLLSRTFGTKPGQINIEETDIEVGMASCSVLEPMTELYRYTGDKKYLDFCNYIIAAYEHPHGPKIISTLNTIGKVNKVANAKAYEMMSNFTGLVKLYQLTGNPELLKVVKIAWNDISTYKLYITGTSSEREHFQEDFVLKADNTVNMGEGCVSTTWLQFNQVMFNLTGESKYMDEIEKTIYNHLLAAENPETGCVSYYTALQGKKPYRCDIYAHCCLASVPRGIAAIPELAITKKSDAGLNINLYTTAQLNDKINTVDGKEVAVHVEMTSQFPEKGAAEININTEKNAEFILSLRVPVWSKNYIAKVDRTDYKGIPGQYLNIITKTGNKSLKILVSFDLNSQLLDGGISYPGYVAIKTGCQILALDQSLNPEIINLDKVEIESATIKQLSSNSLPKGWFGSEIYSVNGFVDNKPIILYFVPFAEAGQTGGELRVWIKKRVLVQPTQPDSSVKPISKALVRFVPKRLDDIAWENDRIAYRIYGPALEKKDFTGSGIDVWVKSVRYPVIDNWYMKGEYHDDFGEGLDFYSVGHSRGCGGLGIWDGKKLSTSGHWESYKIDESDNKRAVFTVSYAPYKLPDGHQISEQRIVTLENGTNLNQIKCIFTCNLPEIVIGIGIAKIAGGEIYQDKEKGIMAFWPPENPKHGRIGCGVVIPAKDIVGFSEDELNYLVLIKVKTGNPFIYYAGACWSKGLDFKTFDDWKNELTRTSYPSRAK